jgi:hypothetical protein
LDPAIGHDLRQFVETTEINAIGKEWQFDHGQSSLLDAQQLAGL